MIPILIVKVYRMIPAPIRRIWSFGTSTSHLALAALEAGGSWRTLFSYSRITWMPFPSWTDPGPQGNTGIGWKLGEGGRGAP